jgi:serine/threonine-protein kinase
MEREVVVGQLIAGKYRIEQMLGRGGMGVVMAALHEHLNQRVALKFLTDDAYQQPEAVARFLREARSAVQIQSEHVARVMDVGTLESGAPYMVMEHLRGLDLKEVINRRGQLPITEAVDFLLQACDAVAEAHSLGIVHRDLKPSNLFLTERPDGTPLVKVLDFGISKALNSGNIGETSKHQMTASAAIMGSPQYMSPEQIRSSKNVDARADVWALGTILHELLAGSPAYVADTVPGLLAMIVADAPPPVTQSRPDTPAELEDAILRCLEKDRDRRFGSVAELARALERFASPETRPLVRRIGRVLGDSTPTADRFGTLGGSRTTHEPAVQTHSTWARTGRVNDVAAVPFYARPAVQLGAGMGLVGVGLLAWFLVARPPITQSPVVQGTVTQPAGTEGSGSQASPNKPDTARVAPITSGAATGQWDSLPPSASGGVRPLRDSEVEPAPERAALERAASRTSPEPQRLDPIAPISAMDDDPRAARNFQNDVHAYPSANAKKKDIAAAARKAQARSSSANKAPRAAPVESSSDDVSPAAPPKKSNTLDLFNDTK